MNDSEDQFVEQHRAQINMSYYVPTATDIKENQYVKAAAEFFTKTLIGRLLRLILIVFFIAFIILTVRGLFKLRFENWLSLVALIAIPTITIVVVSLIA